ncbi:hypothetical protein [Vannielia litorea]|uniref:hypothetical protein n=1 Tax=Vannielia litorea TaxID=1217970 RepID=UPI001BD19110|nr:hypothetical protein [Vannielia litorea]
MSLVLVAWSATYGGFRDSISAFPMRFGREGETIQQFMDLIFNFRNELKERIGSLNLPWRECGRFLLGNKGIPGFLRLLFSIWKTHSCPIPGALIPQITVFATILEQMLLS